MEGSETESKHSVTGYTLNTAAPVTIIAMCLFETLGMLYKREITGTSPSMPITPVRKPVCGVLVCVHHASQKACAGMLCWCVNITQFWQLVEPRWQHILSFSWNCTFVLGHKLWVLQQQHYAALCKLCVACLQRTSHYQPFSLFPMIAIFWLLFGCCLLEC